MNQENFEVRDLRDKEWFVMDDKFLNGYARFLGVYAVGVYVSLCRHADKQQKTYPAEKTIAEKLGIGKNSVVDSIKYLEFWKIIRKKRIGLKCTNRYFLLKKSGWRPISEESLKEFSEVCHVNFKGLQDKLQKFATRTSIVRKHNSNETQKKGDFSAENNSTILETYKRGDASHKPFYMGNPMRWVRDKRKWYVIEKGQWLEYADRENKIEWKIKK